MRKVLRSLCYANQAEKADATANFKHVHRDHLLSMTTTEAKALDLVLDFYQTHGEAPQFKFVHDHFENANDPAGVVLAEEVEVESPYTGATFHNLFLEEVESQAAADLQTKLKTAQKIATQGEMIGKQVVKGVDEAVAYLFSEAKPTPKLGADKIPARIKDAGQAMWDLYEHRKNNPAATYGMMTGYGLFDSAWHGMQPKQMTLLGGFGGHLKSTLMCNILINVVMAGWNIHLGSSEMPADVVKFLFYAIHSGNPMFANVGRPLSWSRMMEGALQQHEEAFFKLVKDDLENNPSYGSIRVIDSSEFNTFGSLCQRWTQDDMEEEIDLAACDYITRLPVDAKYLKMDIVSARNETIADGKRFAMQFRRGHGVHLFSPFQINRTGYKAAQANEGRMDKTHFAQYNAAEKEADNMGYIFFDKDEAATSEPKLGLAKARYGAMVFDPVPSYIDPDCRRIFDLAAGMNANTGFAPTAAAEAGEEVVL